MRQPLYHNVFSRGPMHAPMISTSKVKHRLILAKIVISFMYAVSCRANRLERGRTCRRRLFLATPLSLSSI